MAGIIVVHKLIENKGQPIRLFCNLNKEHSQINAGSINFSSDMKKLFFIACFLPLFAAAQECKLIHATDPYTKLKTVSTGFMSLDGASLTIDASKAEVDIFFTLNGADKCFTDASTAAIFFEGGKQKMSQRNTGSMNCQGFFHIVSRNTATPSLLLRKMAEKKVEKILFTGNNKTETTVTLTPEQQKILFDLANCMLKEAPLLLQ